MKAQIICYNTTLGHNQLDELKSLMPIITEFDLQLYQGEIKLFDNPYTKTKSVDFNWLRTIFDPYYDIKCFVFKNGGLKDPGITDHWGLYSLDGNTKHEYYITNLEEKKLDKRAKANGFKTNFAWMFCHEYLHGSVWGNTRNASQAADLPHAWEKEGVLKEKLAEDVKRYQLLNQTKSLLERLLDLLKKKSNPTPVHPIPKEYQKYISQHFLTPNNLYISGVHNGTDWAVPKGTPIYAPQDGEVYLSGKSPQLGYFCFFKAQKTYHAFLHLKGKIKLQKYKQGEIIGIIGGTGLSFGDHAHWTVLKIRPLSPSHYASLLDTKEKVIANAVDPCLWLENKI